MDRKKALLDNFKCFDKLDVIREKVMNGEDTFVIVASFIFNVSPDECKPYNEDYTKNEEGTRRRNVAKYLCLNNATIDDIAIKYNVPNLHDLLVEAFPWTPYFEIDTDNDIPIDREDRATNAYTFITMIRGYCLMGWE